MKVNFSKIDDLAFDKLVYPFERTHPPGDLIEMDYEYFTFLMEDLIDDLDMIMPAKYQKGLQFRLTTAIGKVKPRDTLRATWITVERGVKDWFIIDVQIDPPAIWDVHPVNLVISPDNEARLWSIIEKVTNPKWFNRERDL